jgi:hypothetical protein
MHAEAGNTFAIPQSMSETIVVADEETDKAVLIMGSRPAREAYVWVNHEWKTPELRWRVFREAHEDMCQEFERKGIGEVFIWVKPTKTGGHDGFAKRLMKRLGWEAASWKGYLLRIRG